MEVYPCCCIIPPHINEHICRHGPRHLIERALHNLSIAGFLRGSRQFQGVSARAGAVGHKYRVVNDNQGRADQPPTGVLVRREGGGSSDDVAVNEAYDGAGATYDFYFDEYQRNSIDDRGMSIVSYVHYAEQFDNAFWDGSQMIYGDGDGELFGRFTQCVDVIAHELTHGVTQFEAGLIYQGQPGALNESFSDVFGALVKQRLLRQSAEEADWLIGAGLLTAAVNGAALRSLKAPGTAYDDPAIGKDPQPAHMKQYVHTSRDNGGVHVNSGIPNRAFYLAATEIGGNAWEKAGRIWYIALRDKLRRNSDFKDAAQATIGVAQSLFGRIGAEARAVKRAWKSVGVI